MIKVELNHMSLPKLPQNPKTTPKLVHPPLAMCPAFLLCAMTCSCISKIKSAACMSSSQTAYVTCLPPPLTQFMSVHCFNPTAWAYIHTQIIKSNTSTCPLDPVTSFIKVSASYPRSTYFLHTMYWQLLHFPRNDSISFSVWLPFPLSFWNYSSQSSKWPPADSGLVNILLRLDLTAAFNTLSYNIILPCLESHLDICDIAQACSHLTDRQHFISLGTHKHSYWLSRCPTGICLEPFSIFIDMLFLGCIIHWYGLQFHSLADDTR